MKELNYEISLNPVSITTYSNKELNLLIENAGIIIKNLSKEKNYVINISQVKSFIDDCVEEIYTRLLSLEVIK